MDLDKEDYLNISSNYVFFWQTGSPFSNWHPAKYTFNGIEFNCSEQGVMWGKAMLFGDENIASEVLNCGVSEQGKMKALGREVKGFKEHVWKNNRIKIYTDHCRAKYTQNAHLKAALMATGTKTLAEASPNDAIWGIGLNEKKAKTILPSAWPGLNLLGKILTGLRDEL
jgi:ribA/ribD-fused uncharacterized protein